MLPKVVRRLQEGLADAELHVVISTSYEQARDLTRAAALAAQSKDVVAVMGGDGMAHLGLNACAGTEATLAVIPAGTGNDFARGAGIPRRSPRRRGAGADAPAGSTSRGSPTPSAPTTWARSSPAATTRVNRATNDIRLRFGPLSYGYIALRELANFEPLTYRLSSTGSRASCAR